MQDVDAVIHADAEDQREGDHVGRVQRHAEQAQNAQRQQHAQHQRRQGDQRVPQVAEVEQQHGRDHQKGVRPARCRPFFIAFSPSTVPNGLPVASGSTVLTCSVKCSSGPKSHRQSLAKTRSSHLPLRADVALAEVGRQVGQRDRLRRRDFAQAVQILGQIAGQSLFEDF